MPIDFSDFLRSTRSDAKLIISNAIKAVHGSKLVTDARDSPTALDFDLEDENGVVETVSIPKGSAVDATARAAAATAQAEIEDHEANHPRRGYGRRCRAMGRAGRTDLRRLPSSLRPRQPPGAPCRRD